MTYDFDTITPRRGTNSYKWDGDDCGRPDMLPMWVADMDFRVAPPITEALQRRVAHGIFGYTRVPAEYYEALNGWFTRRHGWPIDRRAVITVPGVVPAISAIIKGLTTAGDGVVVQTPVYNCFFSSIRNNDCTVVESPLKSVGRTFVMDFDDLERCVARPEVKIFLLCNPHNPAGRVWRRDELECVADICRRNDVTVIADEIHCELVMPGHAYTPFAPVAAERGCRCVATISATKAFNIAGLQLAAIVATDETQRRLIDRAVNVNEVCDVNPFGVIATIAAYNEGEEWLTQLVAYLWDNYRSFADFCRRRLPDFPVTELEGTYLVWMDCRSLGLPSDVLEEQLKTEAGLWLNAGTMYGAAGAGFMRWNIACPRAVMLEGLERFAAFVEQR